MSALNHEDFHPVDMPTLDYPTSEELRVKHTGYEEELPNARVPFPH
jgi:hypothetical protein